MRRVQLSCPVPGRISKSRMEFLMQRLRGWSLSLGVACLLLAAPSFVHAQAGTATAKKSGGKTAPSSAVDINSASQADLEKVPGIGTSTAKKIVAGRPYSSVADLSKAGLSAKQIQTLTPMLTATPMSATAAAKVSARENRCGSRQARGSSACRYQAGRRHGSPVQFEPNGHPRPNVRRWPGMGEYRDQGLPHARRQVLWQHQARQMHGRSRCPEGRLSRLQAEDEVVPAPC